MSGAGRREIKEWRKRWMKSGALKRWDTNPFSSHASNPVEARPVDNGFVLQRPSYALLQLLRSSVCSQSLLRSSLEISVSSSASDAFLALFSSVSVSSSSLAKTCCSSVKGELFFFDRREVSKLLKTRAHCSPTIRFGNSSFPTIMIQLILPNNKGE